MLAKERRKVVEIDGSQDKTRQDKTRQEEVVRGKKGRSLDRNEWIDVRFNRSFKKKKKNRWKKKKNWR